MREQALSPQASHKASIGDEWSQQSGTLHFRPTATLRAPSCQYTFSRHRATMCKAGVAHQRACTLEIVTETFDGNFRCGFALQGCLRGRMLRSWPLLRCVYASLIHSVSVGLYLPFHSNVLTAAFLILRLSRLGPECTAGSVFSCLKMRCNLPTCAGNKFRCADHQCHWVGPSVLMHATSLIGPW